MPQLSRLKPVDSNPAIAGFVSPAYLKQKWLQKGRGNKTPSYENLVLALRYLHPKYNEFDDNGGKFSDRDVQKGIEEIFNGTSLRRFEFLDAISYGIEQGDLDEKIFEIHPFINELRNFENYRNTVLQHKPDDKYRKNINLARA